MSRATEDGHFCPSKPVALTFERAVVPVRREPSIKLTLTPGPLFRHRFVGVGQLVRRLAEAVTLGNSLLDGFGEPLSAPPNRSTKGL